MRFDLDRYRLPPGRRRKYDEPPPGYPEPHHPRCRKCRKPGHYAKTCPRKPRRCHRCWRFGHYAKTCREDRPADPA